MKLKCVIKNVNVNVVIIVIVCDAEASILRKRQKSHCSMEIFTYCSNSKNEWEKE